MKNLTLRNIAACCGGVLKGDLSSSDFEITAITTDSRTVTDGCLFAAIRGERADGHKFAEQVMENGAACVLSEKDLGWTDRPFIQTASTLEALKAIAEFYLKQLNIPVVGVTGSVGKTSTKETENRGGAAMPRAVCCCPCLRVGLSAGHAGRGRTVRYRPLPFLRHLLQE